VWVSNHRSPEVVGAIVWNFTDFASRDLVRIDQNEFIFMKYISDLGVL